ncbi:MAG: hypothetical protein II276_00580 [Bacteroidales bacterium]|nr:hypothetical protein [Bacteroidales bacterium]
MDREQLTIPYGDLQKLLAMASGDGALLYLYLHSGGDPARAGQALHLQPRQLETAMATLRQMGLWQEAKGATFQPGQRPNYTETDVRDAMDRDRDFVSLYGEIQRQLGRPLNVEEMKILLEGRLSYRTSGALLLIFLSLLPTMRKRTLPNSGKRKTTAWRCRWRISFLLMTKP